MSRKFALQMTLWYTCWWWQRTWVWRKASEKAILVKKKLFSPSLFWDTIMREIHHHYRSSKHQMLQCSAMILTVSGQLPSVLGGLCSYSLTWILVHLLKMTLQLPLSLSTCVSLGVGNNKDTYFGLGNLFLLTNLN